ncbi:MAG: rubredoxin [Candidatus Altiarchaeales archaeon WOR_SM1_86-2]|nr:MAG: rubredoxin [Candidatus Altiarchaeales archaeon WOR_SM1_86-2]
MAEHKCISCGHIYDEGREDIMFEDLPDNWKCPECGKSRTPL